MGFSTPSGVAWAQRGWSTWFSWYAWVMSLALHWHSEISIPAAVIPMTQLSWHFMLDILVCCNTHDSSDAIIITSNKLSCDNVEYYSCFMVSQFLLCRVGFCATDLMLMQFPHHNCLVPNSTKRCATNIVQFCGFSLRNVIPMRTDTMLVSTEQLFLYIACLWLCRSLILVVSWCMTIWHNNKMLLLAKREVEGYTNFSFNSPHSVECFFFTHQAQFSSSR